MRNLVDVVDGRAVAVGSQGGDADVRTPRVRLNAFLQRRGAVPERLTRCPGCDRPSAARPYTRVRGVTGSEAYGVEMPAVRCDDCRLVYLNPRLRAQDVAAFYRESPRLLGYFTSGFKADVDRGAGFVPFAKLLERRLAPDQRDLYDLGTGTGAFLLHMAARGFRVAGAEISPAAAEWARERHGLDVEAADVDGALDRLLAARRRFDVVTMVHTFEHLHAPLATLRRIRGVLRPGGLVALNVPNVRGPLAHLDRRIGTGLGGIWDPVAHLSYFSLDSLGAVCERAGYEVVARTSRLLVYGRTGLLGALDAAGSWLCRGFGGVGSNITVIARLWDPMSENVG